MIKNFENYYFEEATISLACSKEDVDFSTYAKREIGKLWEDQSYNQLFNDKLHIQVLINLVNIFRATDTNIKQLQASERLICSHGLYLITHLIYTNIGKSTILNPKFDSREYLKNDFKNDFKTYSIRLIQVYTDEFPNNKFPLSIFKNFKYCRSLKDRILSKEGKPRIGQTLNLFDELG